MIVFFYSFLKRNLLEKLISQTKTIWQSPCGEKKLYSCSALLPADFSSSCLQTWILFTVWLHWASRFCTSPREKGLFTAQTGKSTQPNAYKLYSSNGMAASLLQRVCLMQMERITFSSIHCLRLFVLNEVVSDIHVICHPHLWLQKENNFWAHVFLLLQYFGTQVSQDQN